MRKTWVDMKRRCYDARRKDFPRYGGLGITVCDRWRDSFDAFLQDMGPRPTPKHTIDRINSAGNYEPGNCRWATMREQQRNRRNNHIVEHDGRKQTVAVWAEERGMPIKILMHRLRYGWSAADAIGTPYAPGHRPDRARVVGPRGPSLSTVAAHVNAHGDGYRAETFVGTVATALPSGRPGKGRTGTVLVVYYCGREVFRHNSAELRRHNREAVRWVETNIGPLGLRKAS